MSPVTWTYKPFIGHFWPLFDHFISQLFLKLAFFSLCGCSLCISSGSLGFFGWTVFVFLKIRRREFVNCSNCLSQNKRSSRSLNNTSLNNHRKLNSQIKQNLILFNFNWIWNSVFSQSKRKFTMMDSFLNDVDFYGGWE